MLAQNENLGKLIAWVTGAFRIGGKVQNIKFVNYDAKVQRKMLLLSAKQTELQCAMMIMCQCPRSKTHIKICTSLIYVRFVET